MSEPEQESIEVEVAYALPQEQMIIPVRVTPGSTALQVVRDSGILEHFPEIDLDGARLGIFSKVIPKPAEHVVQPGDRVEIYRPLLIDPKEARANRAKKAKAAREGEK